MRKALRIGSLSILACTLGLLFAGSALAAGPTGDYAKFRYCPYNSPAVYGCIYSKTTSGSFTLGNATVPITSATPIILQGGVGETDPEGYGPFYNAVGADTLSRTKLKVPGGLLGLMDTGGFGGALIALFNAAVASANDVYATAEVVGPITFNGATLISGSGVTVRLPVRVHLENPFLGSDCYVGSANRPIVLNLGPGATSPPPPNRPITGSTGTFAFDPGFTILTYSNIELVDNAFSVPAATGCGFLPLDKLLITGAVNLREGYPAAAGKNTAILGGTTETGFVQAIRDSVQ